MSRSLPGSICFLSVLSALCVLSQGATAADLAVKLKVTEPNGKPRRQASVSFGVPFMPGQVKDAKTLRLLDPNGKEVVAQFRPLARWHSASSAEPQHKDNSLRWVLVDFLVDLKPAETKVFTLTGGRRKAYQSPLKVKQTDEKIVVDTGAAQFTINRKRFNLFDRVRIDANMDGNYAPDEECIGPRKDVGSVVEDAFGLKYYSAEGTKLVEVEEAGPVRVCVVAKGVHRDRERKGYSRGMYGYEIRMHFYVGQALVKLDPVLTNTSAKPIGSPTFEDWSLVLRLNARGERRRFAMFGQAAHTGSLRPGESVVMYQDSNGAATWQTNCGLRGRRASDRPKPQFRGYRVILKSKAGEKTLARADHSQGCVAVHAGRFGVVVVPRYFWQLFPKAIEVGYDGTVRIGVFPREYNSVHWLPDAGSAGQELWLVFQDVTGARNALRQPKPTADNLIPRLVALASREHYAACGALADIGPYAPVKDPKENVPFDIKGTEREYFGTHHLKGDAFGWQVFGCRWEEYAGHSPWNYEPVYSSNFLWKYINIQHRSWLEFGRRRLKHFRDIRCYKIDGTKVFAHTSWRSFRDNNVCEEWCSRRRLWPRDDEAKRYTKGIWPRRNWYLPNPAHNNLDELYDLYCLFGDTRALEGARNVAAVGGAYAAFRKAAIHRASGWCMRSLMRYYDLTGSKECLPYVRRAVDNAWAIARQHRHTPTIPSKSYPNNWFYSVFARAVILAHRVTGDERMRDLAIGMARGRTKFGSGELNSFAWDQTGDKQYYSINAHKHLRYGTYFMPCNAYLWGKHRSDKTPPAAVTDLAAAAKRPGEVRLTWTAPGDDGGRGTATVYQIKWADLPMVEIASDPKHVNFWAAERVTGEPAPRPAGSRETFAVKGLRAGTYYFALKSRDEINNESAISNVVGVEVK